MAIYLPEKIKVGYQARKDTFNGKLAFVVYYNDFGKLCQEKSWEGWRHTDIEPEEYDNAPRSGYMLNKGHTRHSWSHFGSRTTVIRIHDPRGFEFEISPENLVGILMHTDCSKREIQGNLILAWNGGKIMLLPTLSEEYEEAKVFMDLADKKVGAKELIEGATYRFKDQSVAVYLGFHPHYRSKDYWRSGGERIKKNRHIFCSEDREDTFPVPSIPTKIAEVITEEIPEDFANLVEKYLKSPASSKIVSLRIVKGAKQSVEPTAKKPTSYSYGHSGGVSCAMLTPEGANKVVRYTDGYVVKSKSTIENITYSDYYSHSYAHQDPLVLYTGEEKFGKLQAIYANGAKTDESY